jgi:hypothetical protein
VERAEIYLRLLAERELRDRTSLDRLGQAAAILTDVGALDEATAAKIMDGAEMGRVVRSGSVQFPRRVPPLRPVAQPEEGQWRVVPVGRTITARTGEIVVSAVLRTGRGMFLAALGRGGEQVPLEDLVALSAADDRGNLYAFSRDCPAALEFSPTPPADVKWLAIRDDDTERRRVDLTADAPPLAVEPAAGSPAERLLIRRAEAMLAAAARTGASTRHPDPGLGQTVEVLRESGLLAPDSQVPARLAALCRHLGRPDTGLPTPTELPEPWHDVLSRIVRRRRQSGPEVELITPLAILLPDLGGLSVLLTGFGGSRLHLLFQDQSPTAQPGGGWGRFAWSHGPRLMGAPGPALSVWARDADGHHHVAGTSELHIRGSGLASGEVTLYPPLPADKGPVSLTITVRDTTATLTIPERPR